MSDSVAFFSMAEIDREEISPETLRWLKFQQWQSKQRNGYICSGSDLVKIETPRWYLWDCESGYRRGFCHGVSESCDLIGMLFRKGFSRTYEVASLLDEWNRTALYPWRYAVSEEKKGYGDCCEGHPKMTQESWWDIRRRILDRDGYTCQNCGSTENIQCDHINPAFSGGLPTDDNLQALCKRCNVEKGIK